MPPSFPLIQMPSEEDVSHKLDNQSEHIRPFLGHYPNKRIHYSENPIRFCLTKSYWIHCKVL